MVKPILKLTSVHKTYHRKNKLDVPVLSGANLTIEMGERVGIIGPSGSGKSTLLHIAGLLDGFDKGHINVNGVSMTKARERERAHMRLSTLGFVYQFHHLLPELTALENIMIPQSILGTSQKEARARAYELLDMMGIKVRASHYPSMLSGGEQQRVAIARALANKPKLLLADEPTGNLDPNTAEHVFALLNDLVKNEGLSLFLVTHNIELSRSLDKTVTLEDGKVINV